MAIAGLVLFIVVGALVVRGVTFSTDLAVERAIQAAGWGPLEAVMNGTNAVSGVWQVIAGAIAYGLARAPRQGAERAAS